MQITKKEHGRNNIKVKGAHWLHLLQCTVYFVEAKIIFITKLVYVFTGYVFLL